MKYDTIDVYIDGASSGNPGAGGIGIVFISNNEIIFKKGLSVGNVTNNQAEYLALLEAIKELKEMKYDNIKIFSDSELLVQQLNGKYKIKNEILRQYAMQIIKFFQDRKVTISHISREKNKEADKLAKNSIFFNK